MRLSKSFFLASFVVGLGLVILFMFGSFVTESGSMMSLAFLTCIYVAIVMMVLVYKMWGAIQDGHARTSPGMAVGLMFIPLFNLYWAFQVFWGFSKDYNAYIERNSVSTEILPEGLFLAYTVLCFATMIPVLGLILMVVNYIIGLIMISKICDGVNALPE